jgi:uncharacterized protein YkwD
MKKPTASQTFHLSRLVLFSLLAVALLVARGDSGNALRLTYDKNVLAYASNMTIEDLLKSTNKSRSENNLLPLNLDRTLNTSAQLKANDMVEKNYWSHNAPDGTQPWYWFEQAGYSYSVAGENLAYGFSTGLEVEAAWMNSPSHKANILGNYEDVGFGIASSANYQGGKTTVVVAHYGKPRTAEAATAGVATDGATLSSATSSPSESSVSVLSFLQQGKAPLIATISIGLAAIAAAGFALTHRLFMKHALQDGKRFVLHHPVIDTLAVGTTIGLILTATVGHLL